MTARLTVLIVSAALRGHRRRKTEAQFRQRHRPDLHQVGMRQLELPRFDPRSGGFQAVAVRLRAGSGFRRDRESPGRAARQPHRSGEKPHPAEADIQRSARRRAAFPGGVARVRSDSRLDSRRRHLRQRRVAAPEDSSRDARRNHAGRHRNETPARGDRNLHRRLDRRPDAQSAVHAQRRIGGGSEPVGRNQDAARGRDGHHGAHAGQGGGGAHRRGGAAAHGQLSRRRSQQFHRRPGVRQAEAPEHRSLAAFLGLRIPAARVSGHGGPAADAR